MIDFATLQGLTIPEGVVTQIAKDGVVLWKLETNKPVILEVEKITSNTYAGETTYTGEQFILLDIYPKTNGTVKVTYGGLTKTITDTSGAEEPNAQQVFFGTFNGVSDSVETPVSGTLMIEGYCVGFTAGTYHSSAKYLTNYCSCITAVTDWGDVTTILYGQFNGCDKLTSIDIPDGCMSIGDYAFFTCGALTNISSIQCATIGENAFGSCPVLSSIPLAEGVVSIGAYAFQLGTESEITTMKGGSVVIPSTVQSIGKNAFTTDNASDFEGIMSTYLHKIQFLSTVPPALGDGLQLDEIFGYPSSDYSMIVPAGCGEVYKAVAGLWYSNIVEAS